MCWYCTEADCCRWQKKISNAEIAVVVGADAEDVPSSIVEYLLVVVAVDVDEVKVVWE